MHQFIFKPIMVDATTPLAYNYMLFFNMPEMVDTGLFCRESPEKIDKVHSFISHLIYTCPVTA
jgi:hypothetical protein